MTIRTYSSEDESAVVELWTQCNLVVPWNNPHLDIERKVAVQPENLLVAIDEGTLVGTIMVGYDGHRGWINYLAVHPDHRRQGIGRKMMEEAESRLRAVGCPKINLQVRRTNAEVLAFYDRIGFKVDDVLNLGKRLVVDG